MTIKKQLARSHIAMVLIPVLAAGALLVLGLGLTLVLLDRALLARVTANLLDNSRKYGGRENVRVAISARAAGAQAELAFTDKGPGVTPEQLPRLQPGDVLLSGHTHVPGHQVREGILCLNPGSLSIPKEDSPHSYLVWESGELAWKTWTV